MRLLNMVVFGAGSLALLRRVDCHFVVHCPWVAVPTEAVWGQVLDVENSKLLFHHLHLRVVDAHGGPPLQASQNLLPPYPPEVWPREVLSLHCSQLCPSLVP